MQGTHIEEERVHEGRRPDGEHVVRREQAGEYVPSADESRLASLQRVRHMGGVILAVIGVYSFIFWLLARLMKVFFSPDDPTGAAYR